MGTECDIHALKDIRSSAENLASFHNHCLAISFSSENLRKYTSISTYYEQKYLELKSNARYIRKRKKKGIFEYLFLEQTKAFWEQMERSIQILNETTPSRRGWCHGAYNHHNIIMTSSAPATIHFEHFYLGYPILDVYYFLKKAFVCSKNKYSKIPFFLPFVKPFYQTMTALCLCQKMIFYACMDCFYFRKNSGRSRISIWHTKNIGFLHDISRN